jgi:tRNA-specific 2-thiouridylase
VKKGKVIVGMSGGVDSSIAALFLKEDGYDVVGATLKVYPAECVSQREDICCGAKGIASARDVSQQLGIEHRVIDLQSAFRKSVITYFCDAYSNGLTPNPCVVCNAQIKFPSLLRLADEVGAASIATGHYARLKMSDGRIRLMRGIDRDKDQAYFLSRLPREVLRRTVFPLGSHRKEGVKRLAAERGLSVHMRPESQEICFIPGGDYRAFLGDLCGEKIKPGSILDKDGNIIGIHDGVEYYTVGQRRKLYLQSKERRYVLSIDAVERTITVGCIDDLISYGLRVRDINWISVEEPTGSFRALVKIRYTHPGVMSTLTPRIGGSVDVDFDEPQKSVTPGQAAVFYDGDTVLGGGWIC